MTKNDLVKDAADLWTDFKNKILHENRFIIKHDVLNYLKKMANQKTKLLNKGDTLYRARIFTEDTSYLRYLDIDVTNLDYYDQFTSYGKRKQFESGFYGYNESESFVPPDNLTITEGRVNPSYIKYLYTAEDPYTAMVEIRPYLDSNINIASIEITEDLKIVDFSFDSINNLENFEEILMYFIILDFSKPSESHNADYIPTQFVAEFIKSLGFDGIKFTSSLHKEGRNITVFNYKNCKVMGSKLYQIKDIGFEANPIAPTNELSLVHNKFHSYKAKSALDILKTKK